MCRGTIAGVGEEIREMKYGALVISVLLVCSGQMCGTSTTTGLPSGGATNICGRQWYDSNYRVGWNPPPGIGTVRFGPYVASADLNRAWSWDATTPPTEFSLVMLEPLAEKTLPEFRDAWLDTFQEGGAFTVMNESYVSLSDGAQGWYVAVTPTDKQGISSEFMMTVTHGRLVYLNAIYSADFITDAQADQVGDALISLCADLE